MQLPAIPIAMLNELNNGAVLHLLHNEGVSDALMMLFLDLHEYGIQIAGIFWGLWLFPMGYLVFKSGYIPKLIGILLMIGCVGYIADAVLFILYPDFGFTVSEFTVIGEVLLPLWLLIMGVNVEQWEQRTLSLKTAFGGR